MKNKLLYLLPLLLMSCTIEEAQPIEAESPIEEITPPEVINETYTLQGIYRRSIGSQWEVYHIGEQFIIYIQTGDTLNEIYRKDYTYTETKIIIESESFDYIVYPDKIVICGYEYYRI